MSVFRSTTTLLVATAMLAACGDDPVTPDPELTLTVTPAALTIEQGDEGESEVLAVREGSTAAIVLSVTGGGTGVTAALEDQVTDGDEKSATLVVTVTEGAVPGPFTFTVKAANGDADDVTKQVTVTVTEAEEGGNN